jgi:hypothetical protein
MWKRVQFKIQFASNWSLGFWSLGLCLKWPLEPQTNQIYIQELVTHKTKMQKGIKIIIPLHELV